MVVIIVLDDRLTADAMPAAADYLIPRHGLDGYGLEERREGG